MEYSESNKDLLWYFREIDSVFFKWVFNRQWKAYMNERFSPQRDFGRDFRLKTYFHQSHWCNHSRDDTPLTAMEFIKRTLKNKFTIELAKILYCSFIKVCMRWKLCVATGSSHMWCIEYSNALAETYKCVYIFNLWSLLGNIISNALGDRTVYTGQQFDINHRNLRNTELIWLRMFFIHTISRFMPHIEILM